MKLVLRSIQVLAVVVTLSVAFAQTSLTNDAIVKMVKAGLGDDLIMGMIASQPGQYSVTPDALIDLKNQGVSDKIIAVMMTRTSSAPPSTPSTAAPAGNDALANLDIGVYVKKKDEWVEVNPEVVNWKTGGVLKNLASAGLIKGDVNGNIKGGQSKNRVTIPLEFAIKTSEGVAITEYQLIRLHQNKDEREFRTVTGGVLHASGGASRDLLEFEGKRIGPRTYSVILPNNIGTGDFGFLPPGAFGSANSASIGKMYTFHVTE